MDNKKGVKYTRYSEEIIAKFAQIVGRVIVQNQVQFYDSIAPNSEVHIPHYLNNILQILLYEIQIHSINELFSLMLTISASRNRKILSLAILIIINHLRDYQIDYFAQALSTIFDVVHQIKDTEERRKIYSQQISKLHKSKIDEIYFEITENDPLYSIDIITYYQKACQLFISRFGREKFLHLFNEEYHSELEKMIQTENEDSLLLTSLTV